MNASKTKREGRWAMKSIFSIIIPLVKPKDNNAARGSYVLSGGKLYFQSARISCIFGSIFQTTISALSV
jgi:hypothetical protein